MTTTATVATALLALAGAGVAQVTRINGPLTPVGGGDIWQTPLLTADGTRAVYVENAAGYGLFSARVDGSEPAVRLTFSAHPNILGPLVAPDGTRVVFTSLTPSGRVLFSVPIDGLAAPMQLDAVGSASLDLVAVTADSARVVYRSDRSDPGEPDLYSVALDGSGAPLLLNHVPDVDDSVLVSQAGLVIWSAGGNLHLVPADRSTEPVLFDVGGAARLSRDETRVVYQKLAPGPHSGLFSRPLDLSLAPVQLSGPMVAGGNVLRSLVSPDGVHVVYLADQRIDQVEELFAAPIDGSAPAVRISGDLVAGGDVSSIMDPFAAFSPDGSRVLYLADQLTDQLFELFSAPIDASQPAVRLNGPLVPGGGVVVDYGEPPTFEVSADGAYAVYIADELTNDVFELFRAPVDGSGPSVRRSAPLPSTGDVHSFHCSPDGSHVVYLADADVNAVFELFGATVGDLSAPVRLSSELDTGVEPFRARERVEDFWVHPGGNVLYLADAEQPEESLYHVLADGTSAARRLSNLHAATGLEGDVQHALFRPDGAALVYLANGYSGDPMTATPFSVDLASREVARLGGPLLLGGNFAARGAQSDVRFTPDGSLALYRAPQDRPGAFDLYAAPSAGSGVARRLSTGLSAGSVESHALTPDGSRAVYDVDLALLYSVRVDGTGAPVLLGNGSSRRLQAYRISADGQRVLFLETDADRWPGGHELFSAPIDGSAPAMRLHPPLDIGQGLTALEVGADPDWVVFSGNLTDGHELYAVRTDGSQPPVSLSGPLTSDGFVLDFRINTLGTHVVFRADKDTDDVVDLHAVPLDGSAPPVRLNLSRPLADVQPDYQLSHDGLGVAFRADQDTDGVIELYVAPLAGGVPPAKRSGSLVPGGGVLAFRIGPGDEHLVYLADKETDGVRELYRAGVFSGASARVSGPMVSGGSVASGLANPFRITADGTRVVYLADQLTDDVVELFSAPLEGPGGQWRRESAPLPLPHRDVQWFDVSPTGRDLIYRANQDSLWNVELYHVAHPPEPKVRAASPPSGTVNR